MQHQQFKFGSVPTICEDLCTESTNAVFEVSDSVLESEGSTSAELKLPERNFEQERREVIEASEVRTMSASVVTDKKDSSSSQYGSTRSSSGHEYITSESLLLYSSPPSVTSSYPMAPPKVAEDNITDDTHNNFGDSGMGSGVSGTSFGISGMNCNANEDQTSTRCMGSSDAFGGNMNLLSGSEVTSLFHPSGDSGIGMDSDANTT